MTWAVLFDVDGTLVDSVDLHARAWCDALAGAGFTIPFETVRMQIGKGGDQLLSALIPADAMRSRGDEIKARRAAVFTSRYRHQVRGFPHARGLVQRLKRDGARIALATSSDPDEVAYAMRAARIGDLVDAVVDGGDTGRTKPYPDVILVALARLGDLAPAGAIMIGDSPFDMEAARAAGVRGIGVRCGGSASHRLLAAGASAVFGGPADLLRRYDEAFPRRWRA